MTEKLPMLNNDKQLILEFFLFLIYQACFKRKVTAKNVVAKKFSLRLLIANKMN